MKNSVIILRQPVIRKLRLQDLIDAGGGASRWWGKFKAHIIMGFGLAGYVIIALPGLKTVGLAFVLAILEYITCLPFPSFFSKLEFENWEESCQRPIFLYHLFGLVFLQQQKFLLC